MEIILEVRKHGYISVDKELFDKPLIDKIKADKDDLLKWKRYRTVLAKHGVEI